MRSGMRFALVAAFIGCGGAPDPASSSTGMMELRLVDAPSDEVIEIGVTITRVEAHGAGGGWRTIAENVGTVDLLKLRGGAFALLGIAPLPAGNLKFIRLYLDEAGPAWVTTPDGARHPLEVPSGVESGIKVKLGIDLAACATGAVTLDFDGKRSIFTHPTGSGDQWILRPVVRLKSVTTTPGSCTPTPTGPDPTSPPPVRVPPGDACGPAICADGQYCSNGDCLPLPEVI